MLSVKENLAYFAAGAVTMAVIGAVAAPGLFTRDVRGSLLSPAPTTRVQPLENTGIGASNSLSFASTDMPAGGGTASLGFVAPDMNPLDEDVSQQTGISGQGQSASNSNMFIDSPINMCQDILGKNTVPMSYQSTVLSATSAADAETKAGNEATTIVEKKCADLAAKAKIAECAKGCKEKELKAIIKKAPGSPKLINVTKNNANGTWTATVQASITCQATRLCVTIQAQ